MVTSDENAGNAAAHSIKGFAQPLTMAYPADSNRLIVTDV
jgi:hypothetical protein